MTDIQRLDPVISLMWDSAPDGTYMARMTVSGLLSEGQAQAAMEHMRRLFCGQEQAPMDAARTADGGKANE